jgi:hypothetical protein
MLVENATSRGMEAASDLGIARVASEFIAIHDDDDLWESEFLNRPVRRRPATRR